MSLTPASRSFDYSPYQSMTELSVSEIGRKLTQAGRLKARPLCVYGSEEIPGVVPSISVSSCIARAMFMLAFREKTPPI